MTDAYERAKLDEEQWEREHNNPLYAKVTGDGVYVTKENGETVKLGAVEVMLHDSREKLEADVRKIGSNTWWVDKVLGWLDRQANITVRDSGRWRSKYMDLLDERRELEGMIDELQVKVDELNAQNTRLNEGWAEANVQVEKLQAQLAQCMESYADAKNSRDRLQAQLDSAKYDCLTCDAKAELQAKVAELQAKLDAYDETHIELPVDADGVPIRPDNVMTCTAFDTNDYDGKEHVMAIGNGFWVDKDGCTHIPSETRHVKQRTVENVLEEFAHIGIRIAAKDGIAVNDVNYYADKNAIAKYAAEIRELMEVCDD